VYGLAALRPFARRNLVLGTGPLAKQIVQEIDSRSDSRDVLAGVVAEGGDLDTILSRTAPTRIVVALDERRGRLPVRRLLEARVRGIAVEDGGEVLERLTGKIAIESISPGTLAFSKDFRASRAHDALARAGGVLLACAGLVVTAPLVLLIALLIKLDSRGPVLF